MSHARTAALKHFFVTGLLIAALPMACAQGVEPEGDDPSPAGSSGSGGAAGGASAGAGVMPQAGTSSNGGSVPNAFGGTSPSGGAASGGKGGGGAASAGTSSSGGTSSGGTGGGAGGNGGSGGSASGGGSGSGAGGSGGACACTMPKAWMDETSINFVSGDCFTVGTAKYIYAGATKSAYANKECNPAMQAMWCADSGFKFTACP